MTLNTKILTQLHHLFIAIKMNSLNCNSDKNGVHENNIRTKISVSQKGRLDKLRLAQEIYNLTSTVQDYIFDLKIKIGAG